jgi:putative pyruvate formate lyase activating enzyme
MAALNSVLSECELCPRNCRVNRMEGEYGYCGAGNTMVVAHWGLHFGEEPPISGAKGSGNIFFSPCNLRCVFCQNYQISHNRLGKEVSPDELVDVFFRLEAAGAHNINLVSPTPYAPRIAQAIRRAKDQGLRIPFVYNTNAYENVSTIGTLDGLIDIYLPDLKYAHAHIAAKLSAAEDYPASARTAILAMKNQVGDLTLEDGLAKQGLLIRHLVLPGKLAGTERIVRWIKEHLGTQTYLSLMAQYQPLYGATDFPMLERKITDREYDTLVELLLEEGFENVFIQELCSAPLFVPDFARDQPFEEQIV